MSIIKPSALCFSTLLDIDKLTHKGSSSQNALRFSTLLDIDKLTQANRGIGK